MASRPWIPAAEDRALAARLGPDCAFLSCNAGYVHVATDVGPGRSPALDLAQGVWESDPQQSRTILRNRLRLTDPVRASDRAVVDVVAKRVSHVRSEPGVTPDSRDLGAFAAAARARGSGAVFDPGERALPRDLPGWLRSLLPAGADGPRATRDRPVVAVLADATGRIHRAAFNAAGRNRTLHAEVCLVQSFGSIPSGWQVLVSLQPCRMCAAVVSDAAEGPLTVSYLDPDPGRLATRTALQARGWERALG